MGEEKETFFKKFFRFLQIPVFITNFRTLSICAMKKAPLAAEKARRELLMESSKKQRNTSEKTLELSGYILILTTLRDDQYSSKFILDIYRLRWQIELFFKRLKSILDVGHLPKYDDECAKAYLCGKIFIAMLIEIMIRSADDFFPYGNEPISE
ncbi:MAG: transposase [Victivallaceae bacterium]|nr:transposase [Victivallaceae bacterium]